MYHFSVQTFQYWENFQQDKRVIMKSIIFTEK
jgi:hypothetical protein